MAKPTKAKDAGKARIIKQGVITRAIVTKFVMDGILSDMVASGVRFKGPGRPRKYSIEAFRADLEAHPDDSKRRRAKRLGISRRQVDRLLARGRLNLK